MRSRASVRGHPLHPTLIPFPLAFLIGGLVADVAGALTESLDFATIGYYLLAAGVATGLVAGAVGAVDYAFTVPPRSSARKRATQHLALNLTSLALFWFAWFLRGGPGIQPEAVLIAFEVIAGGLLVAGGWIGGTLTFRNQIGVDHRYARAGRWSERRIPAAADGLVTVARTDELDIDQMRLIRYGRKRIVLARSDAGWAAFEDRCTHEGGSLAGGILTCGVVTCPWHGSQFSVETGEVRAGPASDPILVYPVHVEGDEVKIDPRVASHFRRPPPSFE